MTPFLRARAPLLLPLLAACVAPRPAAFAPSDAPARLDARAADHAAAWERSAITTPVMPALDAAAVEDPARYDFWCAAALLWGADVRAARREWEAARQEARAAGRPDGIAVGALDHEFGGEDELFELMIAVDPWAWLGLGPSAAERRVASAAEAVARARLDEAYWDAMMDVEMARIELAASRARVLGLETLLEEARRGLDRATVLFEHGRGGATELAMARGAEALVARELATARTDAARAREALAVASGLPSHAPAFERVTPEAFDDLPGVPTEAREVSEHHPRLRRARLALELAEAEARAVASEAWPRVELGPQLSIEDGTRVGGLVDLTLPWPPALMKRLAAAEQRRDGALEAFEDALHAERSRFERARAVLDGARARAARSGDVARAASEAFDAASARFFVGAAEAGAFAAALELRIESAALEVSDRAAVALAELDWLDGRGVIDVMGGHGHEMPHDAAQDSAQDTAQDTEAAR